MKTPKNKQAPNLGTYTETMDEARKKLRVAETFANDGAQMDSILCAAEAIQLLIRARAQRDAYMEVG